MRASNFSSRDTSVRIRSASAGEGSMWRKVICRGSATPTALTAEPDLRWEAFSVPSPVSSVPGCSRRFLRTAERCATRSILALFWSPPHPVFYGGQEQPRAVNAPVSQLGRGSGYARPVRGVGRQRAEGDASERRHLAARFGAREHAFRQHRGHTGRSKLRPLDGKLPGARSNDTRRQLALLHAQSGGECLDHDGCGGTNAELCSDQGSAGTDLFQPPKAPATAIRRLQAPQPHRNVARKPASPAMLHVRAPSTFLPTL